jgi:nicotinate-nucleotide adenylyltransferase
MGVTPANPAGAPTSAPPGEGASATVQAVCRIGVYGGAFDPPHLDHLAMAQAFVAHMGLQRLVIVPTGHAWHKAVDLSPPLHRLAMARAAFAPAHFPETCEVVVDDREMRQSGPSYTHHTLATLQADTPAAHWALLMGQDQFDQFTSWHHWQDIAQAATIVVAKRPIKSTTRKPLALESPPASQFAQGHPAAPALSAVELPWNGLGLSSTHIRAHTAAFGTEGLQHMVLPPVARYISLHQLYLPHP